MSQNVKFTDIGYGQLEELVNDELIKVFADARDFNKLADSPREVQITIKVLPNQKRNALKTVFAVNSKLGKREGGECQIFIAGEGEEVETALAPMNQQELFAQVN